MRKGAKVDSVTNIIDIGPTMIDMAGSPELPLASGRSLAGFLTGDGRVPDWDNQTFSEMSTHTHQRMIRRDEWKLLHCEGFEHPQLFNLAEDPNEFHDRGQDPECADIVKDLTERVLVGWDIDQIRAEQSRRRALTTFVQRWAHARDVRDEHYWIAPAGTLVFPEE